MTFCVSALSVTRAAVISINSGLGSIEDNGMGGYYGYRESKVCLGVFVFSFFFTRMKKRN